MTTTVNAPADHVELPEFATAMRGYDRLQVDEYIGRIDRWWQESQARMAAAEAKLRSVQAENDELRRRLAVAAKAQKADDDAAEAGSRIRTLLERAFAECDGLRRRAAEEAEATIATARESAVDI